MTSKYKNEVLKFEEIVKQKMFYCFDTETTGFSSEKDDIIEFSALKVQALNGEYKILDELDIYINPGYSIPEEIVKITGINDDKVADCPTAKEAAYQIRKFLGNNPIMMGYNSTKFDQLFMNSLYRKVFKEDFVTDFHIDVMKMAKEKSESPHKLIDMAKRAGVTSNLHFHTSIDDAKATLEVYKYLLPKYKEDEKKSETGFHINYVKRWTRSKKLDRVYIGNNLNASVYYDIAESKWVVGGGLNKEKVKQEVYQYLNITSDDKLQEI